MEVRNPGAGKTIVTGSYTGAGGDNRHIPTGMKCSLVIILPTNTNGQGAIFMPGRGVTLKLAGHGIPSVSAGLHATDGFTVDETGDVLNVNTVGYHWWAISE